MGLVAWGCIMLLFSNIAVRRHQAGCIVCVHPCACVGIQCILLCMPWWTCMSIPDIHRWHAYCMFPVMIRQPHVKVFNQSINRLNQSSNRPPVPKLGGWGVGPWFHWFCNWWLLDYDWLIDWLSGWLICWLIGWYLKIAAFSSMAVQKCCYFHRCLRIPRPQALAWELGACCLIVWCVDWFIGWLLE